MNRITTILAALTFLFFSCENQAGKAGTEKDLSTKPGKVTAITPTGDRPENGDSESEVSNFKQLQGKWQSTDDKTNFLVFENNHRKEIAEGMEDWDDEVFILADRCMNDMDKDNGIEAEKDRYLSCPESDLCWYIIDLNATTLSLSYMGRGNTLTYKRVK